MKRVTTAIGMTALGVMLGHAPASVQSIDPIRVGTIVPVVVPRVEPEQTYALYLPSAYSTRQKWPVIYAFDPAARGQMPLGCFKEGAEKYGYILVASNTSRNGPVAPALRAGLAMIRDTLDRFSIDERRLYVTGFSGGARVACAMAQVQKGRIAGVIGCAAGFPEEENPSVQTPFAFCGTIGNEDYNWTEMNRLDRALAALDKPHRLLRFSGGHTWPPPDVAMAAVEWLELQGMKAGTRPRDSALIDGWLQRDLGRARDEERRGASYEAWLRYADLAATFRGLIDVQPFEARASALQSDATVSRAIKREREAEDAEVAQRIDIARYIGQMSEPEERLTAAHDLYALINVIKRNEQNARTPAERLLARRLIGHADITAFYAGQPLFDAGQYEAALTYFQIQATIRPQSSANQFRLAVTYARAGDKKKALEALKAAADRGFSDATRVEQETGFDKLRDDPRYEQALQAVRKNNNPS